MEFGIFDHLDRSGLPLRQFYAERLALIEAYDRAGFYCYHLAEHHATPLGMAPSPGVFLAAVAARTRSLRFGPLVYLLPFYHPLRLIEEICMLDQLSGGRLEFGVGRGISPIETRYYGLDREKTQAMFEEAYRLVLAGLAGKNLTFEGEFYRFRDVPLELEPVQKPHPPIWYGSHNPESAERCARRAYNVVVLDGTGVARPTAARYREVWDEIGAGRPMPKVGLCRFIVVADDDDEAIRLATRAYPRWYANFMHLFEMHGISPALGARPSNYAEASGDGRLVAGSARTVAQALSAQIGGSAFNYLVGQFAFGDLTLAEASRSVDLFARDVMPALRAQTVGADA
jgi:alkanesulfonate monooxygenase SsuD/methylene tetrahydromethanopterin reductase-like flavin-dependent oxidoreductase (luciferase family)